MMSREPVHVSEIKSYLRCRLYHYWTAPKPRGLNLEPDVERPALHFGRLIHEALQVGYDEQVPFDQAFEKLAAEANAELPDTSIYSEEIRKQVDLGVGMMRGYQDWAGQEDEAQGTRFLSTETIWETTLFGRIKLAGRFDAVVQRDDGIWVLDFKTTASTQVDWIAQDLQATVYVLAARKLIDPQVRGLIFRFLLKREPQGYQQLILKNGSVTQKAGLEGVTTYREFTFTLAVAVLRSMQPSWSLDKCAQVLRVGGVKQQEWYPVFMDAFTGARKMYWEQLQSLKGSNKFFWDVPVYRTPEQIERTTKYLLLPTAKEIVSTRKERWIGPTGLGAAYAICRGCSFSEPCELVMTGADHKSILKDQYRERDRNEYV